MTLWGFEEENTKSWRFVTWPQRSATEILWVWNLRFEFRSCPHVSLPGHLSALEWQDAGVCHGIDNSSSMVNAPGITALESWNALPDEDIVGHYLRAAKPESRASCRHTASQGNPWW